MEKVSKFYNTSMERLTKLQKEVFDILHDKQGDISLLQLAKDLGGHVSRQAIKDRIKMMVAKGYLENKEGKYFPTASGLDSMIKAGGETKHSYYDKERNWQKALGADVSSQEAEEGSEQE